MNNKKKCQQCSKTFQAKRIDALYCSKTCKQNAHYQRATFKIGTTQESGALVFYFEEWHESQIYKGDDLDIMMFFFLRNKLKQSATISEIDNFVSSHYNENQAWDLVKNSKAYQDFRERYLNGEFTVLLNREAK
ncbi:MAG: hypothetical protein ACK4NY_19735 [Spirosomataceae bacterium]